MRFMMLVMIPADAAETQWQPSPELVAKMTRYNEELTKAGVVLAMDGLLPPAKGARVSFTGGKVNVTDGPYAEAKEVVGGYWLIQVKTREEAVEWAKRVPFDEGGVVELRQIAEMSDFPPEVQAAAGHTAGH